MARTLDQTIDTRHLVDKMESLGTLKMFVRGVKISGLADILNGVRIFTIFAPSDKAFYELPPILIDDIMSNKLQLSQIVKHHVIPDMMVATEDILSSKIHGMQQYNTLSTRPVLLNRESGPMVDNTQIVLPDIRCANGILHVIDTILR